MAVGICPRCQNRYPYSPNAGDVVHECNSQIAALDQEDVVVIGQATDPDGTTTRKPSPAEVMMQGTVNTLQGTRGGIEGRDVEDLTARGVRKSTHRSRQHFEYIPHPGA